MRKVRNLALALLMMSVPLVAQQQLPIRRIVIYKNGMAYIVRSGQITTPLSLTFHPREMNDVLKTFAAWNPDTSTLFQVGYSADVSSRQMLERFPFALEASNVGLAGLLRQGKGGGVRIDADRRNLVDRLVAIKDEDRTVQQQTLIRDERLTILADDGSIQNAWLSDVRLLQFDDPSLTAQLRNY